MSGTPFQVFTTLIVSGTNWFVNVTEPLAGAWSLSVDLYPGTVGSLTVYLIVFPESSFTGRSVN
ncbi:hypothetical protein GCM10020008_15010 [Lentilactobacillus kefiri DSM 20587 = JCM 5818]|uniref:Uncharacterized protein n=1 Tax=Lentilactobacillus kefiri TaxID=33962 RepID=A0A511DUY8_LENKE|nr:hypothetical protein LKE01_14750 [Lentilactobacillus kefiri]